MISQKTKNRYYSIAILFALMALAFPAGLYALNLQDAFRGENNLLDKAAGPEGAGYQQIGSADTAAEKLIGDVIQVILSFLGVIFLILMIYGGFLWMTARGNEQQVTKAKDLMIAAIIGMIIVLASFAISYFLLEKFGSATLNTQNSTRLQEDPRLDPY